MVNIKIKYLNDLRGFLKFSFFYIFFSNSDFFLYMKGWVVGVFKMKQ